MEPECCWLRADKRFKLKFIASSRILPVQPSSSQATVFTHRRSFALLIALARLRIPLLRFAQAADAQACKIQRAYLAPIQCLGTMKSAALQNPP